MREVVNHLEGKDTGRSSLLKVFGNRSGSDDAHRRWGTMGIYTGVCGTGFISHIVNVSWYSVL